MSAKGYWEEEQPYRGMDEVIFNDDSTRAHIFDFIAEFKHRHVLRNSSLEPRNRLLLVGPEGNGKKMVAQAIAYEMAVPFLHMSYDPMLSFDDRKEFIQGEKFIREELGHQSCVLFFDHVDLVTDYGYEMSYRYAKFLTDLSTNNIIVGTVIGTDSWVYYKRLLHVFQSVFHMDTPKESAHRQFWHRFMQSAKRNTRDGSADLDPNMISDMTWKMDRSMTFQQLQEIGLQVLRQFVIQNADIAEEYAKRGNVSGDDPLVIFTLGQAIDHVLGHVHRE